MGTKRSSWARYAGPGRGKRRNGLGFEGILAQSGGFAVASDGYNIILLLGRQVFGHVAFVWYRPLSID